MKYLTLNEALINASIECNIKKIDIDIFGSEKDGYKVLQASLRNSDKYVKKLKYEKGKATIYGIDGKPEYPKAAKKDIEKTDK